MTKGKQRNSQKIIQKKLQITKANLPEKRTRWEKTNRIEMSDNPSPRRNEGHSTRNRSKKIAPKHAFELANHKRTAEHYRPKRAQINKTNSKVYSHQNNPNE